MEYNPEAISGTSGNGRRLRGNGSSATVTLGRFTGWTEIHIRYRMRG